MVWRITQKILIIASALMLYSAPAWADVPLVNLVDSHVEKVTVLIRAKNGLLYEKKVKQLMYSYISETGERTTRPYKVPGMVDSRDFSDKMGELRFKHPIWTFIGTVAAGAYSHITVVADL